MDCNCIKYMDTWKYIGVCITFIYEAYNIYEDIGMCKRSRTHLLHVWKNIVNKQAGRHSHNQGAYTFIVIFQMIQLKK